MKENPYVYMQIKLQSKNKERNGKIQEKIKIAKCV